MAFGIIYKATFPNNKIYVGQTIRTLEQRKKDHYRATKNKKNKNYNYPLYRAIRKYGWDNLKWEIIDYGENKKELEEKEIYWIEYYNSFKKGYNSTVGGDGAIKINYKQILDLWRQGLSLQQISDKEKIDRHTISNILKIYNISEKEIFRRGIGRAVIQYDLNGKFINKYNSIMDAANSLGKQNISTIRNCCAKQIRSAYNFLWKFEDDNITVEELVYNFNLSGKGKQKKVEQYDLNGNFIREFNSCREAARYINAPYHVGISSCCIGKQKTAYGYKWKYKNN